MSKSYYFKFVLECFVHSNLIVTYSKCGLLTSYHASASMFCTFHSYKDIINVYHVYLTFTKEINILVAWKRKKILFLVFKNSSILQIHLYCWFFFFKTVTVKIYKHQEGILLIKPQETSANRYYLYFMEEKKRNGDNNSHKDT